MRLLDEYQYRTALINAGGLGSGRHPGYGNLAKDAVGMLTKAGFTYSQEGKTKDGAKRHVYQHPDGRRAAVVTRGYEPDENRVKIDQFGTLRHDSLLDEIHDPSGLSGFLNRPLSKRMPLAAGGGPSEKGPGSGHYEHKSHSVAKPKPIQLKSGQTTEDALRDRVTGQWDKERDKWHQAFTDSYTEGKIPVAGRKPIALILGGGTASGKSTLAKKLGADNPGMVHVDADAIKPQIPEFPQLRKEEGDPEKETLSRNPNLAASRVHEESSYLAKLALAKAAAKQLDIIYDATSSGKGGGTLTGIVNSLHAKGYDVHGLFADVPIETAVERAKQRAADPSDPAGFGRHIPAEAMKSTHYGAASNFMLIKDSPMFKSIKLYDTSGGLDEEPKMIYSKKEGSTKGQVHNEAKWKYYQDKAANAF